MVLPFAHIKIEVYNMVDQSKYNNKHHMKSNSGTIFVLIGDRRLVNKATKVLLNHTTRVTTFIGWFFELPLHTIRHCGKDVIREENHSNNKEHTSQ